MNARYEDALMKRLLPAPREVTFADGFLVLRDGVPVELAGGAGAEAARKAFAAYWGARADVRADDGDAPKGDAYEISATPERLRIAAGTDTALTYALYTLRQLAETERGKPGEARYIVPCCEIKDSPAAGFRGMHICIFPETPLSRIEMMIRLAAYCKFNYAVIEPWGVFPFVSHPEFGWQDRLLTRGDFQRLLAVARECRITLVPQLNIFGHATFSRVCTAKHAVLLTHPEMEPLYEPGGWSYCLSNPETRKVLADLVTEMHEFFGCPPFFHIGCDEAYDFQTCAACAAADPEKLLLDHITYFHDLLSRRNAKAIMWHDMLLSHDDERWKDCIAIGDDRTKDLHQKLPRDIIIADWQYGKAPEGNPEHEFPTANFFQDAGFPVILCPWMDHDGLRQIGAQVEKHKMFGVLETTWHTAQEWDFAYMYIYGATAAWNGGSEPRTNKGAAFARLVRQMHLDMGITEYPDAGHTDFQLTGRNARTDWRPGSSRR